MLRHSGAPPPGPAFSQPDDRLCGKPGIHATGRGLWIPDSPPSVAPRNDEAAHMIGFMESLYQVITLKWPRKRGEVRLPGLSACAKDRYHQHQFGVHTGEFRCRNTTSRQKETIMGERFSGSRITVAIAAAAAVISVSSDRTSAQAPSAAAPASAAVPKTPWGEPDLQGIWTDETDTPLQRPAKYAAQEFFTAAQRVELDEARTAVLVNADNASKRSETGTARDVAGAYNSQFVSFKRTGARTSLVVDPPNGRMPPLTPEAQKIAAAEREFRLALLLATDTCKEK